MRLMIRLAILATLVAGFRYLPWWALLAIPLGFAVMLKLLGGRLLEGALKGLFRSKGAVLRGAGLEVYSIRPAAPPSDDEAEDGDGERLWRSIELVVRPRPAEGRFQLWEPGELRLVRADAAEDETGDDTARIARVERYEDGGFRRDEGEKVPGEQRLRLLVGARRDADRLRLRYYFESIGGVFRVGRDVAPAAPIRGGAPAQRPLASTSSSNAIRT